MWLQATFEYVVVIVYIHFARGTSAVILLYESSKLYSAIVHIDADPCSSVLRLLLLLEMCPDDNYIGTCRRCSVTFRVCNMLECAEIGNTLECGTSVYIEEGRQDR